MVIQITNKNSFFFIENTLTIAWTPTTQIMSFIVKPNDVLNYIIYVKLRGLPGTKFNIILNGFYFNTT